MIKTVFWLAGEASGDLHASVVMKRLNTEIPYLRHIGIGGRLMQAQGLNPLFPFDRFSVMGFIEVVRHLSFFLKVERTIRRVFDGDKPDLAVLVDYPGMNLRIARLADDARIPVLYFICPQFWAWKHKRVFQLKEHTRHVACILPFEKDLLDIHNINSTYVGHPIAEEISLEKDRTDFAQFYGLDPEKTWIGFLPGSRKDEVETLLPIFLQTIQCLALPDCQFLVSKVRSLPTQLYYQACQSVSGSNPFIIDGYTYEMLKFCQVLVIKSGTSTLQAAYLGTPSVIVYKTSGISYALGKRLIRVNKIGLPNIILDKVVLPELIQHDVTPGRIAAQITRYLSDPQYYNEVKGELLKIKALLADTSCSREMVKIIRNLLHL